MKIPYHIDANGKIENPYANGRTPAQPLPPLPSMPTPTPEMLNNDPLFEAIWQTIKNWDINVPTYYYGYMSGTGSHVALIYQAIKNRGL